MKYLLPIVKLENIRRKYTLFLIILPFIFSSNISDAQTVPSPSNQVVIGQTDTLYSNILKERRRYWVSVPAQGLYAPKKLPVMYLLDGTAHFHSVTGMIHQLSSINGNTVVPEMIVVAVGYPDRTRDLTPTHIDEMMGDSNFPRSSGGLDKFTDFLEKELIPHIEQKYNAAPYRTYVGHSLGGLAVTHTLLTRPHLFSNYVSIDPSLWWDDQLELKLAKTRLNNGKYKGKSLFMAVANTLPENIPIEKALTDTSEETMQVRAGHYFAQYVDKNKEAAGLQFAWKYYPNEDHGSLPLIAEYDAIRYLFPWNSMDYKALNKFFMPNSKATTADFIEMLTNHYKKVSAIMGYEVLPDEKFVNEFGYQVMGIGKMDFAKACFEMNVRNYPLSVNVHDSLGDYFMAVGDKENAAEAFKKALAIREVPQTRLKLNSITGQQ
jgi:uncharacterized protein